MNVKSLTTKQLKEGNTKTLEKVYKTYYSKLFYFIKKIIGNHPISPDDLVQQTFLKLWDNRHLLKEDVLLDKQLFVICKNILFNYLKREKRMIHFGEDTLEIDKKTIETHEFNESFSSINTEFKNEKLQLIYLKIRELPLKRRKIFELHKFDGLTYDEISNQLNISKNTVASHLQLATNYLKKECNKHFS